MWKTTPDIEKIRSIVEDTETLLKWGLLWQQNRLAQYAKAQCIRAIWTGDRVLAMIRDDEPYGDWYDRLVHLDVMIRDCVTLLKNCA